PQCTGGTTKIDPGQCAGRIFHLYATNGGPRPTRFLPASSLREKSVPARSLAAAVQSQATARAAHSGGICTDGSSLLTGLMPEALMASCMSVATVPGLRPTTRTPRSRHSLSAQRVNIRTAALLEQ